MTRDDDRHSAMDEEPIFWGTTKPGYNDADRQTVRMVDGRKVVEKFPQHGHVGSYARPQKAPGVRFVYVITHDGNEIAMCLTNGASHLDPNTGYGQYVRRKALFLGWFPPGACPCALLINGDLTPDHIVDKSILEARACPPRMHSRANPCPHSIAEKVARVDQHKRDEAERLANYKSDGDRLLAATHEQTAALVDMLRAAIADRDSPERLGELFRSIQDTMTSKSKRNAKDAKDDKGDAKDE